MTSCGLFSPFVELRQLLPSTAALISPFVDQLMQFIRRFASASPKATNADGDIEIALREALANAIIHGNCANSEKRVYVTCRCTMDGSVSIMVRDEGEGFDSLAVPDPTDPQYRLRTNGRGIHMMKALMDEVSFEEDGKVVRMRKRIGA